MNGKLLKSKMVLYGDKNKDLARALNVSVNTISAKLNNKSSFNQIEMQKIANRYTLTPDEIQLIFFN